ncbi:hypothetical protein HPB51_024525 [Rhipicephalus microplus]|uniref:Nucleic-acid-binding protein from transposon X-element n=1 Tax=Rhipicephalus microplus TaxID=6941 RepID=A0A9J6EDH0_RHIMP|nr:hypothetical protein HPB51_024525 [Rhipicephalus microplus]
MTYGRGARLVGSLSFSPQSHAGLVHIVPSFHFAISEFLDDGNGDDLKLLLCREGLPPYATHASRSSEERLGTTQEDFLPLGGAKGLHKARHPQDAHQTLTWGAAGSCTDAGTPASELHPAMALNAATDQRYHLLDQDGTADDQMDQLQGDHDTVSRDAIGAQSHAEEDASWQAAKFTKKRKQEALERRRGSAGLQDQVKTGTPTFKKLPKLPPLPKDDYKIVIRPNQGLPLRNILTPTLAQAIIEACQAGIRDDHFILRINPGSNIAILSTKYKEVADKVRLIRALVLNGRAHAVRAYAANGDDTLRGVIHGVPMNTSTETLMAHLRVRTHGVEIITARMIGTTKSAAITFFGPTRPRTVYYYGGELRCYPFRPTIQVCKVCREKGHRADVCPHPDRPICRLCGLTNPTDGHPCSISCASCGEAHPTGDPTCKKRLKPPKPKQPQVQAGHSDKLQQGTSNDPPRTKNLRWFSSEEEENAYKSADDKHSSRSHSRPPGRKPHSPSKKSAPALTQQNLHRSPPGGGPKATAGIKDAPNSYHHFR